MIGCLGGPSVPGPSGSPPLVLSDPVEPGLGSQPRLQCSLWKMLWPEVGDRGSFPGHFSLAVASGYGVLFVK